MSNVARSNVERQDYQGRWSENHSNAFSITFHQLLTCCAVGKDDIDLQFSHLVRFNRFREKENRNKTDILVSVIRQHGKYILKYQEYILYIPLKIFVILFLILF